MTITCPNNAKHNEFITTAHVVEEWIVNKKGDWQETITTLETANGPTKGNLFTCLECGAEAHTKED